MQSPTGGGGATLTRRSVARDCMSVGARVPQGCLARGGRDTEYAAAYGAVVVVIAATTTR